MERAIAELMPTACNTEPLVSEQKFSIVNRGVPLFLLNLSVFIRMHSHFVLIACERIRLFMVNLCSSVHISTGLCFNIWEVYVLKNNRKERERLQGLSSGVQHYNRDI